MRKSVQKIRLTRSNISQFFADPKHYPNGRPSFIVRHGISYIYTGTNRQELWSYSNNNLRPIKSGHGLVGVA